MVLRGPASKGRGEPNPFALAVDGVFTSPDGRTFHVPGFYDGDGAGGLDGDVWRVRFSADQLGEWTFQAVSKDRRLAGHRGRFTVTAAPPGAKGFYRWGRLEAVAGARYLKFRDGPYWLKAGCDDPENFLGRFKHYNTLAKRKQAVDYLAARGINSIYIMTHNIDGDHRDVWPWLGTTAREAKRNAGPDARFDLPKLHEWRALFEYMNERGVVPYLVLEDDSAWTGHDYGRYYREMIARFGDLPALTFNFCEEHNERHKLGEALAKMRLLERIDPYDHPRGIHNVNRPTDAYIDSDAVDFTAIQTNFRDPLKHNALALQWLRRCRQRGRRNLVINFDEPRPEQDRRGWWAAYMAGAVWEVHTRSPYDVPMSRNDATWTQLGGARAFMETLPFWRMQPANELVTGGKAFCLATPGEAYALYLPEGGTIRVTLTPGRRYECAWWDPANGKDGRFRPAGTVEGGSQEFTAPTQTDHALRILRKEQVHVPSPGPEIP
jgi:hypothetical protein